MVGQSLCEFSGQERNESHRSPPMFGWVSYLVGAGGATGAADGGAGAAPSSLRPARECAFLVVRKLLITLQLFLPLDRR